MSYILKTGSSGLISVRVTDAGRKKLSRGEFTLNLFQIGDSEMCYNCYTDVLTKLLMGSLLPNLNGMHKIFPIHAT